MLTSQLHSLHFFVCDTGFNRNSCFGAVTCNVTTGIKVTQKWQFHVHIYMWSHYVKKHMLKQVCSAGCAQRTSSKGRKLWTFSFILISLSFPHAPSDQLFVARTKTAVQHGWYGFLFGRNNLTKTRELLKSKAVSTCPTLLQFWRQRKGRRESSYSCTQWGSTGARMVTWPMHYSRPIRSVLYIYLPNISDGALLWSS